MSSHSLTNVFSIRVESSSALICMAFLNHITGVVFKSDGNNVVPLSLGEGAFKLFKFFFVMQFFLQLRESLSRALFDWIGVERTLGGKDDRFFEPFR